MVPAAHFEHVGSNESVVGSFLSLKLFMGLLASQ